MENIGTGTNALSIQNQSGVEVANFWNNASKSTNIFGDLSVDGTTFLNGLLSCNGTVSGTGLSTYISGFGYSTSAVVNTKEPIITVVAPLLKTTPSTGVNAGKNVLSLDTSGVYTVASVVSTGQITCGNKGTEIAGLYIQNLAGGTVAKFWNLDTTAVDLFGPIAVTVISMCQVLVI